MDLRQLRDRPESEVSQFKKRAKQIKVVPILILAGISILISVLLILISSSWLFKPKHKEPIKVFKAIEIPSQQEITSEKKSVPESIEISTDSGSETLTHSMSVENSSVEEIRETGLEFEISVSTTQNESETSTGSQQGISEQKEVDEETRKVAEMLEAKKAEVDRMLREGEQLSAQAQNTMNQAAPILVKHLNSLSREKQREFLNQVRTQMISQFPPEVLELFDNEPELEKKAWQNFLDLLHAHGFDSPD